MRITVDNGGTQERIGYSSIEGNGREQLSENK